jgi:hypothetical protein
LGVHVATEVKESLTINLYVIYDFNCKVYDIKSNKILYKQTFKQKSVSKYLDTVKTQGVPLGATFALF